MKCFAVAVSIVFCGCVHEDPCPYDPRDPLQGPPAASCVNQSLTTFQTYAGAEDCRFHKIEKHCPHGCDGQARCKAPSMDGGLAFPMRTVAVYERAGQGVGTAVLISEATVKYPAAAALMRAPGRVLSLVFKNSYVNGQPKSVENGDVRLRLTLNFTDGGSTLVDSAVSGTATLWPAQVVTSQDGHVDKAGSFDVTFDGGTQLSGLFVATDDRRTYELDAGL